LEEDFPPRPGKGKNRRVAIIGAGPAGLAAAWTLLRNGFQAEIFEKSPVAGGMLRKAIPSYKLSREVLDRETARLQDFGVRFHFNEEIDSKERLSTLARDFDALIIATGSGSSPRKYFPGESAPLVYSGLEFLLAVNSSSRPEIGAEVVVIGKGNTAIDSARSARRLGARARIITLCSRPEMAATGEEIKAAEAEGIEFLYQADILSAEVESGKLRLELKGLKSLPEDGEENQSENDPYLPGSEFTLGVDTVIEAQGEPSSHMDEIRDFLAGDRVFTAGDAVTGSSSIAHAMKSGISAAMSVLSRCGEAVPQETEMAAFNLMGLNRECFNRASQVELPARPVPEALLDFSELAETISAQDAVYESGRCISCGVCNNCDTCMTFCPDFCIRRTPDGYEVDLDYCKGCGICSQECPRDVIDLIQEGS